MSPTLVVFHAHPDDECLLTAGTIAYAAGRGCRVVMVFATDGDLARDAGRDRSLAAARRSEAERSARILGAEGVEFLGYADSGTDPEASFRRLGMQSFRDAALGDAGEKLARILHDNRADVLLTDDHYGGYGHPDHIKANRVGMLAGEMASTPRSLEATIPRERFERMGRIFGSTRGKSDDEPPRYLPRRDITHRVPVHRYARRKRAALRAHASQTALWRGTDRTLTVVARMPMALYRHVYGYEWFVDPAHRGPVATDLFDDAASSRTWP